MGGGYRPFINSYRSIPSREITLNHEGKHPPPYVFVRMCTNPSLPKQPIWFLFFPTLAPLNSSIRSQNNHKQISSQHGCLFVDTWAVRFGDDQNVKENVKVGSVHEFIVLGAHMRRVLAPTNDCHSNANFAWTSMMSILVRVNCFLMFVYT